MVNVNEILRLSDEEKISLIEMIWESLDEGGKSDLTAEQDQELARRIEQFEKGEVNTCSWEEIEAHLRRK